MRPEYSTLGGPGRQPLGDYVSTPPELLDLSHLPVHATPEAKDKSRKRQRPAIECPSSGILRSGTTDRGLVSSRLFPQIPGQRGKPENR